MAGYAPNPIHQDFAAPLSAYCFGLSTTLQPQGVHPLTELYQSMNLTVNLAIYRACFCTSSLFANLMAAYTGKAKSYHTI